MNKKKIIGGTSLLAAGLIAGSMFSISGANAATAHKDTHKVAAVNTTTPATPAPSASSAPTPPSFGSHKQETPITGDLATTLTNLALAKYPRATVDRVENDTDGDTSEVHLTLSDGSHVTVKFDASNAITKVETGGPGGFPGDKGGPRGSDHDGDGPAAPATGNGLNG